MNKKDDYIAKEEQLIRQQRIDILALKRIRVLDENNKEIYFSTFWEKKTVVVFIRHFGCIACRAHVSQITDFCKQMKGKAVNVIFIGNGLPSMIKGFKEELKLGDVKIYTDPSLESFDACGMNRSFKNLVNVRSLMAMRNLHKQGYRQGAFDRDSGSHRQMGGVVAFDEPGIVLYHFTSEYLGDFDDPSEWENFQLAQE